MPAKKRSNFIQSQIFVILDGRNVIFSAFLVHNYMTQRNMFDIVNSVILKFPAVLKFPADDL